MTCPSESAIAEQEALLRCTAELLPLKRGKNGAVMMSAESRKCRSLPNTEEFWNEFTLVLPQILWTWIKGIDVPILCDPFKTPGFWHGMGPGYLAAALVLPRFRHQACLDRKRLLEFFRSLPRRYRSLCTSVQVAAFILLSRPTPAGIVTTESSLSLTRYPSFLLVSGHRCSRRASFLSEESQGLIECRST